MRSSLSNGAYQRRDRAASAGYAYGAAVMPRAASSGRRVRAATPQEHRLVARPLAARRGETARSLAPSPTSGCLLTERRRRWRYGFWLSASPCTTTTGHRKRGPEPLGSGKSAHRTSPGAMVTSRYASEHGEQPFARSRPHVRRSRRAFGPSPRSHELERDGPRIPRRARL
jgi:hypothetical protein